MACPMIALLQSISIFVSTMSITAIALDRRRLIICPHERPYQGSTFMILVPVVWAVAITLASPLAVFKKLESWTEFPKGMAILRYAIYTKLLLLAYRTVDDVRQFRPYQMFISMPYNYLANSK